MVGLENGLDRNKIAFIIQWSSKKGNNIHISYNGLKR